jgi:hypothetical protein
MYCRLSLLSLAELIAHKSDKRALQELHDNRTVFYYHSNWPLRLAEFADKLRQSRLGRQWCKDNAETLEKAYDLTISKFSNLPDREQDGQDVKLDGPDCRYYFEAFIKHAVKILDVECCKNEVERETKMAGLLQNLVIRHFRLSCLECCRVTDELTRRYRWKVNGHILTILLPAHIPSSQCSKWLAANVPDVDPSRPGERDRVQAVVDRLITRQKVVSLESINPNEMVADPSYLQREIEQEMTVKGLASVVADEKAHHIESQRAAIRQLGKDTLRSMICQIFESLSRGTYEPMIIADRFGLSRPTFTRFAGSRWLTGAENRAKLPIPDLWLNTAQTLAGHPAFVRAAETAGVLKHVQEILQSKNASRSRTENEQ